MTKTTPLLFLLDVDFDLVNPISLAISASLREKTELQNPHRRGRRPSRAEYFVSGSDSSASRPCQHSRSFVSIRGSNNLRKSAQSADEIWLRLCRARWVRVGPCGCSRPRHSRPAGTPARQRPPSCSPAPCSPQSGAPFIHGSNPIPCVCCGLCGSQNNCPISIHAIPHSSLDNSRDKSGPDARQAGRSCMDILRAPNNAADGLESSRRRATGMKNNFLSKCPHHAGQQ